MAPTDSQSFVNYLEGERAFSPHTVRAYLNDVGQLCDYLRFGPAVFDRPDDTPADAEPALSLEALRSEIDFQARVAGLKPITPQSITDDRFADIK